ncbi:MAG TPA: transcriptional regulator [Spirochaeta sp.]|nr:transcriptional regulator [Spirochaeta sp.]
MENRDITDNLKELSTALSKTDDPDLILEFLECLLTRNEMSEVASRWALVKMLDQGTSQRNIASQLGLSLCKITRGSKELQKTESAFKKMIDTV